MISGSGRSTLVAAMCTSTSTPVSSVSTKAASRRSPWQTSSSGATGVRARRPPADRRAESMIEQGGAQHRADTAAGT